MFCFCRDYHIFHWPPFWESEVLHSTSLILFEPLSPKWKYSPRKMVRKTHTKGGHLPGGYSVDTFFWNGFGQKSNWIHAAEMGTCQWWDSESWWWVLSNDYNYTAGFWGSRSCGQSHIARVCGYQHSNFHSSHRILADQGSGFRVNLPWNLKGLPMMVALFL